jgi:hypothetical protein
MDCLGIYWAVREDILVADFIGQLPMAFTDIIVNPFSYEDHL